MLLAIFSIFFCCVDHVFSSSMIEPGSHWRTSSFSRKQPGRAWTCWCPTTAHSMGSIWSFNLCWCLTWWGGYLGRCWELVGIEGKNDTPPLPQQKPKPQRKKVMIWIMKMKQSVGTTNHPTQDAGSSPPGWHEPFLKLGNQEPKPWLVTSQRPGAQGGRRHGLSWRGFFNRPNLSESVNLVESVHWAISHTKKGHRNSRIIISNMVMSLQKSRSLLIEC